MRHHAFVLCLLLALCGCAAPTVRKQVLSPAPAADVARLTRLRVAAFDNDAGGQVRAAVESALAAVTVDGRPYFTIIGPNAPTEALGKPLQWVDRSKSKAQPIRYGSEGLVQGSVNQNGWTDDRRTEKRSECVVADAKGNCLRRRNVYVQCITRVARFSFTPRVLGKDTGEVLMSQEFAESGQSSACLDEGAPTSGATLLAGARAKAIALFRNHVAPHAVTLDIPLLAEDDSGMSAQTKTLVSGGVDFATAGQTDKACALWRSAARSHGAGHALPYLLGVCAELENNLDQAEASYALAAQQARAPVPEVSAALWRIKTARADRDRLEHQLK